MTIKIFTVAVSLVAATSIAVLGVQSKPASKPAAQDPPVNPVAHEMAEFVARVDAYNKMRDTLSGSLPKLSDKATPEEIDKRQRALAALVVAERASARQGDFFIPEMQNVVRALMARVFKNPQDRAELRASIQEENPGGVKLAVNMRYPDTVPLATMPPEVLKNLPKLPDEFEYRFVGESLILFDTRAHLVVDFMSFALPKA